METKSYFLKFHALVIFLLIAVCGYESTAQTYGMRDDGGLNLPRITYWHTGINGPDPNVRGVDLNNVNIGGIYAFFIKGVEIRTWKNEGAGGDVTGTTFHYKVWRQGDPEPSDFLTRSVGFTSNDGFGNQTWANFGPEIPLVSGLNTAGTYNFKFKFSVQGTGDPGILENGPFTTTFDLLPTYGMRDDGGINLPRILYWHSGLLFDTNERGVDFNGKDFGQITELFIKGAEIRTWKFAIEGGDVTGTTFSYKVWNTNDAEPADFVDRPVFFTSDDGAGDQTWSAFGNEIEVTAGLPPGTYNLKIFFSVQGNGISGVLQSGPFTASFTIPCPDQPPLVSLPDGSANVACLADAVEPTAPVASDVCDGIIEGVLVNVVDTPGSVECQLIRTYTYSYTNSLGNTAFWNFTYTVAAPQFFLPPNAGEIITCASELYQPTPPSVTDNCGNVILPSGPVVSALPECEGVVNYVWTYTDCAGNSFDWTYTFTIEYTPFEVFTNDVTVTLDENGSAFITVEDVNNGSVDACGGSLNFTLSQSEFGFDDIGNVEVILYAEDCAGNTASGTAVVTVIGPSAVIAYTGDKHGQYSDQITLSAILTDENTGAPLSNRNLVFTLGTQAFAAVTNASGVASADLVLNQEPGLYDLLLEFEGDDVYPATSAIEVFEILPENANLTYIGTRLLATKTGTTVNLDLRVVLEDVEDDFRGEIINTDVTFLISWGGNSEIITTVLTPDNLVSNQKAVLSVPFPVTLAQGEASRTLNILVTAGDYYTGEEQVVTVVYVPSGDHITGGGFIVPDEGSSGLYPSAPGSHANFGFNFRYHPKTGKLKGRTNLIIRGESGPPVKFKSTQPLSMGINNSGDHPTAQFTVKGDLTQGGTLLFSDVMMYVTLTDRGNPGFKDDIGFTIWSGNTLIYSSDWQGNFTERQNLGGGNLVIHRGGTDAGEDVDILADPVLGGIEGDARFSETMGLNVYPNPFRGKLTLSFTPQTRQRVVVEIYDMSGKLVETIFDAEVLENDQYTIEYIPAERKTAVLFYRFIAGEKVIHGKIIQQQ